MKNSSHPKKAWVRYDDGKQSGTEQYILQIYDWNTGEWETSRSFPFCTSQEFPNDGKNYLHYDLVKEIVRLSNLGYHIDL